MSITDENKSTVRRLIQEVYDGDLDRLDEFVSEVYQDHSRRCGRDGLRKMLTDLKTAYPDLQFSVADMVAEGDKVAVHMTCDCGRDAKKFDSILILRLASSRVVEQWGHSDSFF